MGKIIKYVIQDILKNKIIIAYMVLLFVISMTIFNLQDHTAKGLLSLMNIALIVVPLICIIFSTIYIYNSAEFMELLVSQPLRRKQIWMSFYFGIASSLSLAFILGVGLPVLFFAANETGLMLVMVGWMLTLCFVSIALLATVYTRDKAKGIGIGILLWLYFSLIFDGLVLFLLFQFADYPMDTPMLVLSGLNPVDTGRILILLKMDASALMGYTGAVFRDFFGGFSGAVITVMVLLFWILLPAWLSVRKFNRKNL